MSDQESSDNSDHEKVGYCHPPQHTRFQKGQSGNPRGRPRNTKKRRALHEERLKTIILDEAYRTTTAKKGDRNITVSMAEAVVRSIALNAAKGSAPAQKLFTELVSATERDNKRSHEEYFQAMMRYKSDW